MQKQPAAGTGGEHTEGPEGIHTLRGRAGRSRVVPSLQFVPGSWVESAMGTPVLQEMSWREDPPTLYLQTTHG